MPADPTPPTDIHLEPWEWYTAGWRKLPPLPRTAPKPFDKAACLHRLSRVRGVSYRRNWAPAAIGPHLDPDEGRFWLEVFARRMAPAFLAQALGQAGPLMPLDRAGCARLLAEARGQPPEIVPALASQMDLPNLLELLLEHIHPAVSARSSPRPGPALAAGFRQYVRPYLDEAEMGFSKNFFREHAGKQAEGPSAKGLPLAVAALMASLGMTGEILPRILFQSPAHGSPYDESSLYLFVLLGLDDAASIPGELERRDVSLRGPAEMRALIAALEEKAVPRILQRALRATSRVEAEALTAPLTLILRPQAAPALLILSQKSKGAAVAQRWLDRHPELAVPGVLPLLGEAEHAEIVLKYLRQQVRVGRNVLIEQHLGQVAPEIADRVRRGLDTTTAARSAEQVVGVPDWFPPLPARPPRLPAWLDLASLPPLLLEGKRLAMPAVAVLLSLLRESSLDEPSALLAQIKKQAEPRARDAFTWAVLERWLSASGDAKDKWALLTVGLLGGDGVCLPLSLLIEEWDRQSLYFRATLGLQCLRAINTRLSLLCLRRLGVTHTNSMGHEADALFHDLAERSKLSVGQLEDRCVPDLGLDAEGYRRLDCCGTTYRLTIGPDLQARLVDARRQYLDDWPALAEGQDPVAVEEARSEWGLFRDQVRAVVDMQMRRLERDLLGWRRWPVADFRTFILRNGLMFCLARSLLWGAFSTVSVLRQAFRLSHGGSCLDAAGVPVSFAEEESIGLVHPVLLSVEERLVWSDVLGEQGLDLPAWQLARPVRPLLAQEKDERQLNRWSDRKLKLWRFADLSRRWKYDLRTDPRGRVRYYPGPNVTVYLLHSPIPEGQRLRDNYEVSLQGAQFHVGKTRGRFPDPEQCLPLGSVDPVLLDEVIGILEEMACVATGPA